MLHQWMNDSATFGLIANWSEFGGALLATAIFGAVGIAIMLVGFKLFDMITPKIDLEKELAENKNIAVAIVVSAMILGIAMIVSAAMS